MTRVRIRISADGYELPTDGKRLTELNILSADRCAKIKSDYEMYNRLVKNKRLLLSLPLLLAASLFVPSHVVPSAHAQFTGLVCITSSTTATSCPTAPPSIGPIAVGSMFSVGVFVQNSDPLVGWDVYVAANSSILSPTSAALGNLVPNPSLTGICINGVAQTGSCTQGTANGPGVVEVTTIDSSGSNVCNNPPPGPCSGMAFTITYKVVGVASSSSLFYPTSSGCSQSSVSSPPNVCVLISNAFGTTLPENIQGATVATSPGTFTGLVCITSSATATRLSRQPRAVRYSIRHLRQDVQIVACHHRRTFVSSLPTVSEIHCLRIFKPPR